MTRPDHPIRACRQQAFGQFRYLTVPLGVSGDFMNTMMRRALDRAFAAEEEHQ
jgi:hypothetical protein